MKSFFYHKATVITFCLLFFPVGWFLLLTKKEWDRRTKLIGSGFMAAYVVLLICGRFFEKEGVRQQVAKADVQWEAGDKDSAFPVYSKVIREHVPLWNDTLTELPPESLPYLFGRCIDYCAAKGFTDEAQWFLANSRSRKIIPITKTPEADALIKTAPTKP